MTVEITVDDIDQQDLNDICQVFKVDFEDDKNNNNNKENEKENEKEKDKDKEKEKPKGIFKTTII